MLMDCGGVEDPIDSDLLQLVSCLSPNETELARLTGELSSNLFWGDCLQLISPFSKRGSSIYPIMIFQNANRLVLHVMFWGNPFLGHEHEQQPYEAILYNL